MLHRFRPDPELSQSAPLLSQRLLERGDLVDGVWLRGAQAALALDVLAAAFRRCGADEGTVWLLRDGALVPAFNTGPNAALIVDLFRQPVDRGIIGMVAVTEQSFCANAMAENSQRDPTLDGTLHVETQAMMAVPLAFAGALRGVVSCVQLAGSPQAVGFEPSDLESLDRDVHMAGRLVTLAILESVMGLHGH
jgi:hypothetical protein